MINWKAPRNGPMVWAGVLSLFAMFMAFGILLFFTESTNENLLIRYIWLPPVLLLPSYLAGFISTYLQRFAIWLLSAVIYSGEFAVIRDDCSRPNANCVPPNLLVTAFGSLIGPQVLFALAIVVLLESSYRQASAGKR